MKRGTGGRDLARGNPRAPSGKDLAKGCEDQGRWDLEVIGRDKEMAGFKVVPKRCMVERTFA